MPSVTLRDLAVLAGCSHSTVSLALRNHPRIPVETRERIHALARDHGYSQDAVVSSLMTQLRTARKARSPEKLAFVNLWTVRDPNHFTTGPFVGAAKRAEELGYELEEFWAKEPGMTGKRLTNILYTRAIRGLVVGSLARPKGHLSLNWSHFATVTISQTLVRPSHHCVTSAKSHGISLTIRTLRHRGYKRIGFTGLLDESRRTNEDWLAGYLVAEWDKPLKERIEPLMLEKWDGALLHKWIRKNRLEAVVSNNYQPLHLIRELGFDVPGDLGFAVLDRLSPTVPCAGIDQQRGRMGAAAVDLVVSLIERNQFGVAEDPKTVQLQGVWRDGPTIRRLV